MVGGKIEVLKRSADSEENRIDMLLKEEKLNIIVEDIGKEYLYETLFEKILGCSVKVIASGGKQASLKVSKEIKAKEKDFDMLAEKAMNDPCKPGNPREVTKEDFIELFRKAM